MTNIQDELWMRRALALAERGRGYVEPNPLVGAVLVRDGQNVGEGWHQRYGQAHAEVNAIVAAGEAARGATLYVTLEPCCHHGKTPPCTDAVLRAGIRRVVTAMADPFPQVSGKGVEVLRPAGIEVAVGVLESESRQLNAPYLKLLARGRPWVHAKWAMTLDGKIATASGDSQWISNEASRRRVHALRGRMDAIIVGGGTVHADNPLLTARPPGPRTATRIVLEGSTELPSGCQLVRTAHEAPVLVVQSRQRQMELPGVEVIALPTEAAGVSVEALLDELGRRRMTNVLVEGGSAVLGSFLTAGALDEVHVFIAPKLAGGADAKSPIGGAGVDRIADALRLLRWSVEQIEGDIYIHGWTDG
ncbi:MAG: bifunctional diaminohydroxyphosphoribosylaminopyrimidine deaminase/5-amino-6-(5-phosphoribosylamino)uracil reductase RibD [Planctomycetia bacterium]|nr:bifunctional diaminohydroxyphosphoribosylaminopyrimidine deaminase/5-amino-6-(5-phosphoribosylamino)uracil reductase RibD [Planctomycetia bacterium]